MTSAHPGSGIFITLEGGEGAGKSHQAKALTARLEAAGHTVVRTREPGGTPLGEKLREVLLGVAETDHPVSPMSEALLFLAARAALVSDVIAPALERGDVVICDRYGDSTRAYQGFGRDIDVINIDRMNDFATQSIYPDLTALLDLPVDVGLRRTEAAGQDDRFGREDTSFHERVRQGYLTLARAERGRWLIVDATQPPEAVTNTIWQRIDELLSAS